MRLRWTLPHAFLLLASAAGASPFQATLTVDVLGAELSFTGSGNGFNTKTSVTLPGGTFSGTASGPIPGGTPSAKAILDLDPGGAGSFAGSPLAGPMPLRGLLRLESKAGAATLPLNSGYDVKAFGVGGVLTYTFPKPPLSGAVKFHFASWHAGMATVPGGATMFSGKDERTPGGMGQITFVSPAKIDFATDSSLIVGSLRVEFVPEPGAPLLLATGAALLCAIGARRRGDGAQLNNELPPKGQLVVSRLSE